MIYQEEWMDYQKQLAVWRAEEQFCMDRWQHARDAQKDYWLGRAEAARKIVFAISDYVKQQ